jgi:hypothetical protein
MEKLYKLIIMLFIGVLLTSCGNVTPRSTIVATATSLQSPAPISSIPTIFQITSTPTFNPKTYIITPDDLFSFSELKALSTLNSEDFCEHLPPPQIVANSGRLSLLSGRFVLCSHENWPWVTNTAMDLDTGSFVSKDDERADIVMENAPGGEEPAYGVVGRNNAYINDAYVLEKYANHSGANRLSYEYCENMLRDQTDPGGFLVAEGVIACVKTTEGKIALIRVEKIYPPIILSVEFSFVILGTE